MNQKAFTLFTALVSFILIILVWLLIQAMQSTESSFMDNVSDIEERAEMQAVADMARADSLQIVNFAIRFGIERWITQDRDGDGIPENVYLLDPSVESWDDTIDHFATTYFGSGGQGGVQLANQVANHISSLLSTTPDVRGYKVDLIKPDPALLTEHLQKMIEDSASRGEFFEVIKCPDGEFDNCLGTFYINLDMSVLTDDEYEDLPQIRVENTLTGRVLQEPVLPRGNFRIYVPLRLFKAIAGARELARTSTVSREDYGLFSPRIHNELEEMRLGICDVGYCNPRTDLYVPPEEKHWTDKCPGQGSSDDVVVTPRPNRGIVSSGRYNPEDYGSINRELKKLAEERVDYIANAIGTDLAADPEFELLGSGGNILTDAAVTTTATPSKVYVGTGGVPDTVMPLNYNSNEPIGNPGAACPMQYSTAYLTSGSGGVGFWKENGRLKWLTGADVTCPSWSSGIYCSEIVEVKATVAFKENNDKYRVSELTDNVYAIALLDSHFTRFTPKYHADMGGDCLLSGEPQENASVCTSPGGWRCGLDSPDVDGVCAPV